MRIMNSKEKNLKREKLKLKNSIKSEFEKKIDKYIRQIKNK